MKKLVILIAFIPSLLSAAEIFPEDLMGLWSLPDGTMSYQFNEKSKVTMSAFGHSSESDFSLSGNQLTINKQLFTIKKLDLTTLALEVDGQVMYLEKVELVKIEKGSATVTRISNFTSDGLQKIVTCSDNKRANVISMSNKVCIQKSLKIVGCRSKSEWTFESAAKYFCENL